MGALFPRNDYEAILYYKAFLIMGKVMDDVEHLRDTLMLLSKEGRNFAEFAVQSLAVKKAEKPPNSGKKPPGAAQKTD